MPGRTASPPESRPKPRAETEPTPESRSASRLVEQTTDALNRFGQVGLLTVHFLEAPGEAAGTRDWNLLEDMVGSIRRFLFEAKPKTLRREDRILEVTLNGNTLVVLIAPPRNGSPLRYGSLSQVRTRLEGRLRDMLHERSTGLQENQFGCHVGCAVVSEEAHARIDRQVWAALDTALADALRARDLAGSSRVERIRTLLVDERLHAVYQPIVDVSERTVLGYEALSRPAADMFPRPDLMLKAASETGLLWDAERLCRKRIIEGLSGQYPAGLLLFINVEPDSLEDPEFRDSRIVQTFESAGILPDRVVLEMTEHSAVQDFQSFRKTVFFFRSLGFKLAIDDMGAGFSGLKTLTEMAPEFIKMDLSLIRDIHLNPLKQEMIASILRFAANTGSAVISEGVEKIEEMQTLRRLGVRFAQGYLLARPGSPLPAPDLSCLS